MRIRAHDDALTVIKCIETQYISSKLTGLLAILMQQYSAFIAICSILIS